MRFSQLALSIFILPLLFLLCSSASSPQISSGGDAILGVWLTGTGKGKIKIYKEGDKYYGKLVWLRDPNYENGTPKVDKHNPDNSKKNNPLLGILNLRHFTFAGKNKWEDGKIYDPENGKEYSCKIELVNENTLEVRGYVGISLFGRTDVWKRQADKY